MAEAQSARRPLAEIQEDLRGRVAAAFERAVREGSLPAPAPGNGRAHAPFHMEIPARREHGDFATNAALSLASAVRRPPRQVAEAIVTRLAADHPLARVEVAGPGFINFFMDPSWLDGTVDLAREPDWGDNRAGAGRRLVVEFVSANPTGPLNVVNARAAAYGDSLCRILAASGFEVTREYYVNDAGNQFDRFAESVAARYAQVFEGREDAAIPEGGYPGQYVVDLMRSAVDALGRELGGGERAVAALPPAERARRLGRLALEDVLGGQREVLARFRVRFDRWTRESELRARGAAEAAFAELERSGHTYEADGAVWLRTMAFGDDKDRVIRRSDGTFTYIVPDIAYHLDKLDRGDAAIDLLGPDHHGYLVRLRASLEALGRDPGRLEFLVSQSVHLVRGGDRLKMSKRQGDFVSMEEFLDEVDLDAARWFFVARSFDSPMEFDLDLANLRGSDNPVYYVQYAHARIASLLERAREDGFRLDAGAETRAAGPRFSQPSERALLWELARFPEEVAQAAQQRAPHRLTTYAHDLAAAYHTFYTECRVLDAEPAERRRRLELSDATRNTLARCLDLLGVVAPDRM